ncbi:PepSY domain-containing protein [Algiphilus sp.]|uniref:PepSY domain-containing protein n=1 Tax=Algiphilus sp. TaxID=1872431 RepID=UPI003C5398BE
MQQHFRTLPMAAAIAAASFGSLAHADRPVNEMDAVIERGVSYGFTHFEEIELKSRGRSEMEGFLGEDGWYAEVTFDDTGEPTHEERSRRIDGAWGMQPADVRQALAAAAKAGLASVEEIQINSSGYIDVEGHDAQRREIEMTLRLGSDKVIGTERD